MCEAAKEAAGANRKRDLGTALHALTEQLDRGESPTIPEDLRPDIEAYLKATANLRMCEIEVFVVNDALRAAGTFDRLVEVDGVAYLADLKTGSLHQAQVSMQLALYASGERYDPATGARSPLDVNQDRGLVIHLPSGSGTCALHWADLRAGWKGVELAAKVWTWRDTQPEWLAEPAQEPEPAPAEPATEQRNSVAQPAPEPQQPRALLIAGASSWSPSKGDVIRERLGRIPAGVKVLIVGDVEARSQRGLPVGAAAISWVALLGRKDVTVVPADGLDEALSRAGYVLIFHPDLPRGVKTSAVVEKARVLGLPIEVVDGGSVEAAR